MSLVQYCQISNIAHLQSKLSENFKTMCTNIADQSPPRKLKYMFSTGLSILL